MRRAAKGKARPSSRARPVAVVFVGDLHTGHTQAVCPPAVAKSPIQRHLCAAWKDLTGRVGALAREADVVLALGGDLVEGFHHGNTDDWAVDEDEQAQGAIALLAPLAARAKAVWAVTGTEAHAGRLGSMDKLVSRSTGDKLGSGLGARIFRPGQDIEIQGRWLDWQHHGASMGRLPWTRDDALYRMAKAAWWAAHEVGQPAPALVMRHHLHVMPAPGQFRGTLAAICGAWQGVTAFGARVGHKASDIGCWVWWPAENRLDAWRWPWREKAYHHGK